jgi:hypothetical protein
MPPDFCATAAPEFSVSANAVAIAARFQRSFLHDEVIAIPPGGPSAF